MTKPKFTPDPPPYLQGMSVEKAFPLFVDWVIRQEYRKEDWWPKDFESRVQALERLVPYCIGEWTIADAAYINFSPEVVGQEFICGQVDTISDGDYPSVNLVNCMDYSPEQDVILVSVGRSSDGDPGLFAIDVQNDSVASVYNKRITSSHLMFSAVGGTTSKEFVAVAVAPFQTSSSRLIEYYSIGVGGALTFLGSSAGDTFSNIFLLAENDIALFSRETSAAASVVNKTTLTRVGVGIFGGWSRNEMYAVGVNSTFLYNMQNTSTNQFFFGVYSGSGTIPVPTVAVDSSVVSFDAKALKIGNRAYWPVSYDNGTTQGAILVTDLSGNEVALVDADLGIGTQWASGGQDRIFVDDDNSHLYYLNNGYLYYFNVSTFDISKCQLDVDPSIVGLNYYGLCLNKGNKCYVVDDDIRASTSIWFGTAIVSS